MDPIRFDEAIEGSHFWELKSLEKSYGTLIFVTIFTEAVNLFVLRTG
jgi:hypothetical protein